MVNHAALVQTFADYASTIARRYDVGEVLYRLVDQVVDVLGIDGAGVSIVAEDGRLRFVSATDDDVIRIEEAQTQEGEGPCQDAFHQQVTVTSDDLMAEGRWSQYIVVARDRGCRAVAGIPMAVGDRRIGALNMYRRTPGPWSEEDLDIARILADMATGYVLNAITLSESAQLATHLEHALKSRTVIEQAKGVLAERHGIDATEAFNKLRVQSRNTRTPIHQISRDVISRRLAL